MSIGIFLSIKVFHFFLGMNSPIPAGIFGPFVVLGCIFGRFYGILLKSIYILIKVNTHLLKFLKKTLKKVKFCNYLFLMYKTWEDLQ